MLFNNRFSVLLKIFFISGSRPVPTESNLKYLPVIVSTILSITTAVYLAFYPHFNFNSTITVIISYSAILTLLFMILNANVQCCFAKCTYQGILNQIQKIERKFEQKTSRRLPIESIALRYRLKAAAIVFLFFLSQGLVLTEVWLANEKYLSSSFLRSLIRSAYPIQILHFVLYSDILVMFMHKLNDEIKDLPAFVHSSSKMEFLEYVKLMHMNLWKLVGLINKFFGWNLLFTVIYSFVYITFQLYWIFYTVHGKLDVLGAIGKTKVINECVIEA